MFSISSGEQGQRFCDGLTRRDALQVGAMSVGGLTLADLLRSEAQANTGSSHKALINIHLAGGPSHQDMFDLQPAAPPDFRGEVAPPVVRNIETRHLGSGTGGDLGRVEADNTAAENDDLGRLDSWNS